MALKVKSRSVIVTQWENKFPEMPDQEVYIFSFDLNKPGVARDNLEGLLDDPERKKAAAFRQSIDRQRYITARTHLKKILGKLTGVPPESISILAGENGKPYWDLADAPSFNLTHSGDQIMVAIGSTAVGIDVERVRSIEMNDLLQVFSDAEQLFIQQSQNKCGAFFNLWTRKEALVKALGIGMTDALNQLEVLDGLSECHLSGRSGNFEITSFATPDNNYAAAVCTPEDLPLKFFELSF